VRLAFALLAISLSTAFPQDSSVVSLSNGVQLRITAAAIPADSEHHLKAEFKAATGNSVYRVFRDDTGLAVYAYELVVDRLADGNHFQIAAKPAGQDFATKFPNADGGKPTPTLSQTLQSPPLNSGGRFTVEIPTNPGWFEHRTDTVQIGFGGGGTNRGGQSAPLLRFAGVKVSINGAAVPILDPGAVVSGRFVMFYIPEKGGYFFSSQFVDSRAFIQAGVVDGTRLKFTIDNESYDVTADVPILVGSQRGQLWVYRDANYKPAGNLTKTDPNSRAAAGFFTAASDSLDWWLP
jgi:hypothetical protein